MGSWPGGSPPGRELNPAASSMAEGRGQRAEGEEATKGYTGSLEKGGPRALLSILIFLFV